MLLSLLIGSANHPMTPSLHCPIPKYGGNALHITNFHFTAGTVLTNSLFKRFPKYGEQIVVDCKFSLNGRNSCSCEFSKTCENHIQTVESVTNAFHEHEIQQNTHFHKKF